MSNLHSLLAVFALSAAFSVMAPHAATAQSETLDCAEPQDQSTMNRCAFLDFEAADGELNAIWPAAQKANQSFADYLPENQNQDADALLDAQRLWIQFRDAHCSSVAMPSTGGTIYPLIYNSCRAELTRQRTQQLKEIAQSAQ